LRSLFSSILPSRAGLSCLTAVRNVQKKINAPLKRKVRTELEKKERKMQALKEAKERKAETHVDKFVLQARQELEKELAAERAAAKAGSK